MTSRGPYRRHSTPFKLQLCQDIRAGVLDRRDAQRSHNLSANLIQLWLSQFDRGELNDEEAEASVIAEYEGRTAALGRKVGQLTMELDLAKNTADLDRERQREILRDQRPRGCSVRRGCKAMTLPRSTYYYRSTRKHGVLTDAELVAIIEDIQDELPCYGYRRVTHELRRRGLAINHKRIARVMRMAGLGIKPRKRFVSTTDSRHDFPVFPKLYRNLIPDQPDKVWVADFTYIRVAAGFCYLAVILDACSRKVVGYALSQQLDTELALAALHAAVVSRSPPKGCIHHADRGCQYASQNYRDALEAAGLRGSIRSVGNPYHNAQAESFMKALKVEEVYRAGYETFADMAARLPMFLEQIHSAKRLHSALGYRTPEEFETLFA